MIFLTILKWILWIILGLVFVLVVDDLLKHLFKIDVIDSTIPKVCGWVKNKYRKFIHVLKTPDRIKEEKDKP